MKTKKYKRNNMKFFIHDTTDIKIIDTIIDNFGYGKLFTVLDVGVHVGAFSLCAAKNGANVYALEPDIQNFYLLQKNIIANSMAKSIYPIHVALSNINGLDVLTYEDTFNHGQRSLSYIDKFESNNIISTVTLEELFRTIFRDIDTIDCLKMDIEGKEFDIFRGSVKRYINRFKYIDLDIHSLDNRDYFVNPKQYRSETLMEYIKNCGFEIVRATRTSGKLFDTAKDGNFIFKKK